MTDRELLEAAAKAAGYTAFATALVWSKGYRVRDGSSDAWQPWNPLTDDGDALRLAVKLHMLIEPCRTMGGEFVEVVAYPSGYGDCQGWASLDGFDHAAATRGAIVRAAAAMAEREGSLPDRAETRSGSGAKP